MRRYIIAVIAVSLLSIIGAHVEAARGESPPIVRKAVFEIGGARIAIYVPWDLRANEQVSGAIDVSPQSAKEKLLAGYHVEVNGTIYPLSAGWWGRTMGRKTTTLRFRVLDARRKVVGLAIFKVDPVLEVPTPATFSPELPPPLPKIMDHLSGFDLPKFAVAGKPFRILGPYDGEIRDDVVWIHREKVEILAESFRTLVVRAPLDLEGDQEIQLYERGTRGVGKLRIVASSIPSKPDRWQIITDQFARADRITEPQALRALCDWAGSAESDLKAYVGVARKLGRDGVGRSATVGRALGALGKCCPPAGKDLPKTKSCVDDALAPVSSITTGNALWSRGAAYLARAVASERTGAPDCMLIESTLEYLHRLASAASQPKLADDVSSAQGVCEEVWKGRKPAKDLGTSLAAVRGDLSKLLDLKVVPGEP